MTLRLFHDGRPIDGWLYGDVASHADAPGKPYMVVGPAAVSNELDAVWVTSLDTDIISPLNPFIVSGNALRSVGGSMPPRPTPTFVTEVRVDGVPLHPSEYRILSDGVDIGRALRHGATVEIRRMRVLP